MVEVGSNVSDFFPGEVVRAADHVVCGRCRNGLVERRPLINRQIKRMILSMVSAGKSRQSSSKCPPRLQIPHFGKSAQTSPFSSG